MLIHSITNPINKLLGRAEHLTASHKKDKYFTPFKKDDEIKYFYTVFDEVLSLLKSNLKEQDIKDAKPLLERVKRADKCVKASYLFFCKCIVFNP